MVGSTRSFVTYFIGFAKGLSKHVRGHSGPGVNNNLLSRSEGWGQIVNVVYDFIAGVWRIRRELLMFLLLLSYKLLPRRVRMTFERGCNKFLLSLWKRLSKLILNLYEYL